MHELHPTSIDHSVNWLHANPRARLVNWLHANPRARLVHTRLFPRAQSSLFRLLIYDFTRCRQSITPGATLDATDVPHDAPHDTPDAPHNSADSPHDHTYFMTHQTHCMSHQTVLMTHQTYLIRKGLRVCWTLNASTIKGIILRFHWILKQKWNGKLAHNCVGKCCWIIAGTRVYVGFKRYSS